MGRKKKVKPPKKTPLSKLPRNQYGDVIFPPIDQQDVDNFGRYIEDGWEYQTSDPEDEVEQEDFINSYIAYFKKKREKIKFKGLNKLIKKYGGNNESI